MLTIVFKFFTSNGPDYIDHLLRIENCQECILKLEHFTTRYGRRSFRYAAPRFWNKLPRKLRTETCVKTFKKGLKYTIFNDIGNIMNAATMYLT